MSSFVPDVILDGIGLSTQQQTQHLQLGYLKAQHRGVVCAKVPSIGDCINVLQWEKVT